MTQRFFVSAHRFTFRAEERIRFPAMAANKLRGALGFALRDHDRYFRPKQEKGPSGFADPPRPFVLRAHWLNDRTIDAGESFSFDLHLFVADGGCLAAFTTAFKSMTLDGSGVQLEAMDDRSIALSFEPDNFEARRISVEFLTPTELKHQGELVEEPTFPVLFTRIRERICALARFYSGINLEPDLMNEAAQVSLTHSSVVHQKAERRSHRTGQTHPLGGFTGTAVYEGALGPFLPWLEAAYWTGVGRQTVWGKGAIRTAVIQ
jgi:hypothetical protein